MGEQLALFAMSVATPTPLIDPAPSPPPDQQFRDIVANQLHTNLFIGAGAGSGKTTALVARVVNLVRSGVPIGEIAAITFTEKAAAELRHRIREALADPQAGPQADEPAATMMAAARKDLDHAPIGTLHAFANRVLADFPIEASLPPRFEVLDEVSSANAFNERYDDFLEDLLDSPQAVRLVELCDHDGFKVDPGIRRMAEDFQANWDLVAARVSPDLPSEALPRVEELVALCDAITAFDVPPNDTMAEKAARVALARTRLTGQQTLSELLHELNELAKLRGSGGNKATWKKYGADEDALPAMRASMADLGTAAVARIAAFNEERRYILGAVLRRFTLDSVAERQAQGKLEFHDLLVLARRLAFENHGVRRALHDRYTRLLLDEFQDTDPIQLDLAVRIAADPEQPGSQWNELQPLPGRLCLVGDPKQSIYRFRRADISQFLDAASTLDAESVTLSANFRSTPAVIDWVNQTMSALIIGEDHVQPQYVPLAACRTRGIHPGSVTVLGAEAHDDLYGAGAADELRTREAGDVADVIVQALSEGWLVGRESEPGGLGPCRPGDITVLLPARTSLNALEVALAERGIAHRAENSSLVYAAPEIRSLLLALRAADDPTDELAIVSVLRSTLFGCSDRDLYDWHATHGRRWTWRDEAPQHLNEHPVAAGLAALGEVAAMIPWSTPSQLLTHLASRRAVLELALADEHSRDIWRRVRFVIDQARAWSEAGGHGVRHYLAWTRLQGEDGRF
ncbi:MAG: UvrD-helicase domain-containing protein, partial [Ilumatobacteraceae bacterium]